MSQLKKQSVAGRKTTRRVSKSSPSTGPRGTSRWKNFFKKTGQFLTWILLPLAVAFKRWPKITLISACALIASCFIGYGTYHALKNLTQSLPTQIDVNSPRSELKSRITEIAEETLQTARREKWSRTALADKLLSRLSSVEGVDEITVRAGLDRKLLVTVAAQAPLLVLQGKDNERILVGSQFKIIARGLGANEYTHLLQVEASDLNLNVKSSKERRKANTGLFVRPSSSAGVNIRWLSQHAIRLQNLFLTEKIPVDVEKVVWKTNSGFSAIVKTQLAAQGSPSPEFGGSMTTHTEQKAQSQPDSKHKLTIVFGDAPFNEKFTRLAQVLQDLRTKKLVAEQIDLAFSDKAIIRMADQLSDNRRGAAQ